MTHQLHEERRPTVVLNKVPSLVSGSNMAQANLLYSDRESNLLQDIFHFFITKYPVILHDFFDHSEKEDYPAVADAIVSMSFSRATTLKLVYFFLEFEFQQYSGDTIGSLMRENSVASKVIKDYLKKVGMDYLKQMLGDFATKIVVQDAKKSLEIDKTKTDPDIAEKNITKLLSFVTHVVNTISNSEHVDAMPPGIRKITLFFADLAEKYCPANLFPLVGGFLMLRYINPALFSPDQHDLIPKGKKISPQSRRNLILITKVLQNLSNNMRFSSKEMYMTPLNEFIDLHAARLQRYFKTVIDGARKLDNLVFDSDVVMISVQHLHMIHRMIFQHSDSILKRVEDSEDKKELEKMMQKLGSYFSKVSFAQALDPIDQKYVKEYLSQTNEEACFIGNVDLVGKKKAATTIIVVGLNRVFFFKPGGKILFDFHSLDLLEIRSLKVRELVLKFRTEVITAESDDTDEIISSIRRSFATNFHHVPPALSFAVDIEPPSRVIKIQQPTDAKCDGFVGTYRSLCNYYSTPINEDMCWDINNVYEDNHVINVRDFFSVFGGENESGPLTCPELVPVIKSMCFNTWFSKLVIKDYKLDKACFQVLIEMARLNPALNTLVIPNISGPKDQFGPLFEGLKFNRRSALTHLDISHNTLDERAMTQLASLITHTGIDGIVHLNIASASANAKAFAAFARELCRNLTCVQCDGSGKAPQLSDQANSSRPRPCVKCRGSGRNVRCVLEFLDISNNKINEAADDLSRFLVSGVKTLKVMKMGHTFGTGPALKLVSILAGIIKGCPNVQELDLANVRIVKKEEIMHLARVVFTTPSLNLLNLSNCQVQPISVQDILQSVSGDSSMKVILSGNNLSGASANILMQLAPKWSGIVDLDISNTDLNNDDCVNIIKGLVFNTSLTTLNFNNCFKSTSSTPHSELVKNLIKLISSDCCLEVIKMAGGSRNGSQLMKAIIPFLLALSSSSKLTTLDISNHQFGVKGAIALSKLLKVNAVITSIFWDDNSPGRVGLTEVTKALKRNQSIRTMPLPIHDLVLMSKNANLAEQEFISSKCAELENLITKHNI